MAMLADLLQKLISPTERRSGDGYMVKPPEILDNGKSAGAEWNLKDFFGMNAPYPDTITGDDGMASTNQTNPFLDAIRKSREGGPGILRQFLGSVLGGELQPFTGTVGGGGPPNHTPGTEQDAALNPTPMKQQKQKSFAAPTPQPQLPPPPDYSMPQALDPVSIEELRTSLLTQAGQLDASNPNGLAGRMTSPNASVDQRNQMNETQQHSDSLRGFDGSRQQKIKASANGK